MDKHIFTFATVLILCAGILCGCVQKPVTTRPPETTASAPSVPETTATEPTVPETTVTEATVPETSATEATVPETTAPPETTVPETSAPTEPAPPPTTAPQPTDPADPEDPNEMIGKLYTRGQLMAMENEKKSFGCGISKDGSVPPYSKANQDVYGKYNAFFYNPNSSGIALTFDCGYEYSYVDANGKTVRVTEQILDTLKEKDVKAVFFVTMYYVKSCPDLVQRMIDEGHTVGNHTANHPVLPNCSIDKMVREITKLHTYVEEHFGYSMNLLRPPEGAFSTRSLAVAQSLGYATVDWSFAYADWDPSQQPDPESALKTMVSRSHNGAIYLLHAVSATNAAVLPDLIDTLRDMGYTFVLFENKGASA